MSDMLAGAPLVHDPFAGTGERLGKLCDDLWIPFSGTEIEASFIVDPRVKQGSSVAISTYPTTPYVLCTSPVYPNGMADHWKASDGSVRKTYRAAVGANEGQDRELHPDNMGRYGYRGTGPNSKKRQQYWELAEACVKNWGGATSVVLNVSDFMSNKILEDVTNPWIDLMERNGWTFERSSAVHTPRMKLGSEESRNERVQFEYVMRFVPQAA